MESEVSSNPPLSADDGPFNVLNEAYRRQLWGDRSSSAFARGEFIHRAGHSAKGILYVLSGVARISSSDSDSEGR